MRLPEAPLLGFDERGAPFSKRGFARLVRRKRRPDPQGVDNRHVVVRWALRRPNAGNGIVLHRAWRTRRVAQSGSIIMYFFDNNEAKLVSKTTRNVCREQRREGVPRPSSDARRPVRARNSYRPGSRLGAGRLVESRDSSRGVAGARFREGPCQNLVLCCI